MHACSYSPTSQPEEESDSEDPVTALGFRIGQGLLHTGESQWAVLRDQVQAQPKLDIKAEVKEVDVETIYYTQRSCSGEFRNGLPLEHLVQGLRDGCFHPLQDEFLILNVVQTEFRLRQAHRAPKRTVYFSLDNRRLKCMKDVACKVARVRVVVCNKVVDELINKAEVSLRSDIRVRDRQYSPY